MDRLLYYRDNRFIDNYKQQQQNNQDLYIFGGQTHQNQTFTTHVSFFFFISS